MRKWKTPFYSFANGQVAEDFTLRSDTAAYYKALYRGWNWWPLLKGGLKHRPGTRYVDDLAGDGRLLSFLFDQGERYLLLARSGELQVRSATSGALLETCSGMPWNSTTLWTFDWVQSGDTLIVVDRTFSPRKVTRTAATTFTASVLGFDFVKTEHGRHRAQPMAKPDAAIDVELTPAATTGDGVTVTASDDFFTADHVGRRLWINNRETVIATVVDGDEITVDIDEDLTDTDATADWKMPAWVAENGYPATVTFHAQRLWFAGTPAYPNRIWGSKIGTFFNMDLGEAEAADAIEYDIVSNEIQEIEYLVDAETLQVFSKTAVWAMPKLSGYDTTPGEFGLRRYGANGCARVRPAFYDDATVYADTTRKGVREVLFDDGIDGYAADLLTVLTSDAVSTPRAFAIFPGNTVRNERVLFCANDFGSLGVFHSLRQEKVTAWFVWNTAGDFRDVVAVGDRVFFIVEREIDGVQKFYLERMDFNSWMDSSVATGFSGGTNDAQFAHLIGEPIVARKGERVQRRQNVSQTGNISMSSNIPHDEVGLEIDVRGVTLPVDGLLAQLPMHGTVKRIYAAHVELRDMNGLEFEGTLIAGTTTPAKLTDGEPFSGQKRVTIMGFSPNKKLTFRMTQPSNGSLLGFTLDTVLR